MQQVSGLAPRIESYLPYLDELADVIRALAPSARIVMHQTWAYEAGSERLLNIAHYATPDAMLDDIKTAYAEAARRIGAVGIIPSGEMLSSLLKAGIPTVHRDTFHASLGLGRYALGLLWYRTLCGASVASNPFRDLDEVVSEDDLAIARACAERFAPLALD